MEDKYTGDKYIVAIEIGSSKIRGALASVDSKGMVNILASQEERVDDSVRYGQVKNIEEVSNKVDAIRSKLQNSKIAPAKITAVYAGVSGFSVGCRTATEELYLKDETEITPEMVRDLKEKTAANNAGEKDIYEIIPCGYLVDNEQTLNPAGRVGRSFKGTFKIIEGNPGLRSNLNRVFPERLNLKVNGYIVSILAQADAILSADEKQLGCMLVDLGAETTTTAIYKGGVLRWLVTLPMGSRNITRDITTLNYLEEQAESIKRSVGIVLPGDNSPSIYNHPSGENPEIANYIHARASEIIANVLAQIEYAGLKPAELPTGIVLTGGGARLRGFSELFSQQSKMKVRIGMSPRVIRVSDASILVDEALDVISLVLHAAHNDPQNCITEPESSYSEFNVPKYGDTEEDEEDDGISRIGSLDDDDYDIDDDFQPSNRKKNAPKPPKVNKTPKKPIETPRDKEEDNKPKRPSFFQNIGQRLVDLISDPEDDKFSNS